MNKVKPAQRVRVGVEAHGGQILQFFSYVKKVSSDRLLLIFHESKSSVAKFLPEGKIVKLSIYTPMGILLVSSIVLSAPENCEFEVEFIADRAKKRIQRRKYVRAKVNYRIIIDHFGQIHTALSEDIGGGGVRFICDKSMVGDAVKAKLYIPEVVEGVPFTGVVEKKSFFKENEYLIQFAKIDEIDRNKIIQKCLEIEAKNIREY